MHSSAVDVVECCRSESIFFKQVFNWLYFVVALNLHKKMNGVSGILVVISSFDYIPSHFTSTFGSHLRLDEFRFCIET